MVYFVMPGVAILIIAASTAVLIRRDRRRMEVDIDTPRIESAATRGIRDPRHRTRASDAISRRRTECGSDCEERGIEPA
ncbi:hypothetical protein [Streptomyces tailanensis]|uniref:hypothetical protein n=1 Tax=Streptomyces tailanensis TaxID=2569858 RepID=UPI00122E02BC|nr:hypothetical protein [Streptomyces tailanensis]